MKKSVKLTALLCAAAIGAAACFFSACGGDGGSIYHFNGGNDLKTVTLSRLPIGSIRAKGHLYERLSAQAENITYDMYEIDGDLYRSLIFGNGTHTGVPSAAYYLRGLAYTAYTLGSDDPIGAKCIARTEQLLENIYAYAEQYRDDPNYGGLYVPPSNQNWIDKQEVGEALQCVYEYTGNVKALTLLENYYVWLKKDLSQNAMAGNWEGTRKADIMDSGIWLYNQTKSAEIKQTVVEVLRLVSQQAIDWEDIMSKNEFSFYNFYTRHIVNVTQGLKEPIENYLLDGDRSSLDAFYQGLENLMRDHGRIDGLINGSEQLSGRSSIEGVETCAVVEMLKSLDRAYQATGDIAFADQVEKIGYNSLPAAFSRDMKSISYFNPTNLVQIKKGVGMGYSNLYYDGNPGYCTDADEDLGLGPHPACHCCSVNCHIGYPEFINSMYYATDDRGVMVALYGPSECDVTVGKGQQVTVKQETNYPYEDTVNISVETEKAVKFPLKLRIPTWAESVSVTVNGERVSGAEAGGVLTLNRSWKSDDVVKITFSPEVTQSRWANNSVGVTRGSLVFSLNIGEAYSVRGVAGSTASGKTYYDYDVTPTTDWNYGLVLENSDFASNFELVVNPRTASDATFQYYDQSNYTDVTIAPVLLKVKARKIPGWTVNDNGILAEEVPVSPVASQEKDEYIYLSPYAAGKLRVANIPEISIGGADVTDTRSYSNDFKVNETKDFLFFGPVYNVTGKGFGTYFKINYGSDVTNDNDVENAWGHSAFNPKAILDGYSFRNFTLETTIAVKGTSVNNYGVIFRATDISHSRHGFRGYYLAVSAETDEICLYRTDENFQPILIKKASIAGKVSVVSGVQIKLVANGPAITVYVGGEKTLEVTDGAYTGGGQVGFVVHAFDFMAKKNQITSSANKLSLAYAVKNVTVTPL